MDKVAKITIMSGPFKGLSPGMYYFVGTVLIFVILIAVFRIGDKYSEKIPCSKGNVVDGCSIMMIVAPLFIYLFFVGNTVPVQVANLTNGKTVVIDSWVGARELVSLIEADCETKDILAEVEKENNVSNQEEDRKRDKNSIYWRIKRAKEVYAKKKELIDETKEKSKIEEIEETRKIAYSFLKYPFGRDASDCDEEKRIIDRFFDLEIEQTLKEKER